MQTSPRTMRADVFGVEKGEAVSDAAGDHAELLRSDRLALEEIEQRSVRVVVGDKPQLCVRDRICKRNQHGTVCTKQNRALN